jgi:hypothetical protein
MNTSRGRKFPHTTSPGTETEPVSGIRRGSGSETVMAGLRRIGPLPFMPAPFPDHEQKISLQSFGQLEHILHIRGYRAGCKRAQDTERGKGSSPFTKCGCSTRTTSCARAPVFPPARVAVSSRACSSACSVFRDSGTVNSMVQHFLRIAGPGLPAREPGPLVVPQQPVKNSCPEIRFRWGNRPENGAG